MNNRRIAWLPGLLLLMLALCLGATAMQPQRFTGEWYSADGTRYHFQEGLITGPAAGVSLGDGRRISGAYQFTARTVTLFLQGHEDLDQVRTLYYVKRQEGDILSRTPEGTDPCLFRVRPVSYGKD